MVRGRGRRGRLRPLPRAMVQTPDAVGGGRGDGVGGRPPGPPVPRVAHPPPLRRFGHQAPPAALPEAHPNAPRVHQTGSRRNLRIGGRRGVCPGGRRAHPGRTRAEGGPPPHRRGRGRGRGRGTGTGTGTGNGGSSAPMVYAASWWSRETFDRYMTDSAEPMWNNLRSQNVELYREVRRVYMGDNPSSRRCLENRARFGVDTTSSGTRARP